VTGAVLVKIERRFAAGRGSTAPQVPCRSAARGTRCGRASSWAPKSCRRDRWWRGPRVRSSVI